MSRTSIVFQLYFHFVSTIGLKSYSQLKIIGYYEVAVFRYSEIANLLVLSIVTYQRRMRWQLSGIELSTHSMESDYDLVQQVRDVVFVHDNSCVLRRHVTEKPRQPAIQCGLFTRYRYVRLI